ncbi:MAG: hypothetical protein R3F14_45675, partial [Polyangiaceae bacterium]
MVTTGGWLGDCPGGTEGELLDFLRGLPSTSVYDVVRRAEPLSDVSVFRIPGGLRRHYEEIERWPGRFLVLGDALCSLNPLYSQGMTVTALEVEALLGGLDGLLSAGAGSAAARALQGRISAQAEAPWAMAESEDLRFPEIPGQRTWRMRAGHVYGSLLSEASSVDAVVGKKMLEVIHLIAPPSILGEPAFRLRVLGSALRARLAAGAERT